MFPLTSSNIAQTLGHGPSHRLGRRATASAMIVAAAAIALLAFAHTSADAAENSSRMAQEHACAVVMGLDPKGDLYDTCIRSLGRSLSELAQAHLVESDRSVCAQKGLKRGTPAFAICVIKVEQLPADAARHGQIVPVR